MTEQQAFEMEILQPRDLLNEYIMTSLRTREGLDLAYIRTYFGEEKVIKLENQSAAYILSKQMEYQQGKLILTGSGKLFADGIAAALFFD